MWIYALRQYEYVHCGCKSTNYFEDEYLFVQVCVVYKYIYMYVCSCVVRGIWIDVWNVCMYGWMDLDAYATRKYRHVSLSLYRYICIHTTCYLVKDMLRRITINGCISAHLCVCIYVHIRTRTQIYE